MHPTHTIEAVIATPASGPGALAGWVAVCSCGYRIPSSLRTLAVQWGADHARYMNAKK